MNKQMTNALAQGDNTPVVLNGVSNEVYVIEVNGQAVVSTRNVAEKFGKEHKHILRDVENIKGSGVVQNWADLFISNKYQHPQNKQWYPEYLLTRDGFTLLAMGFTGKDALEWKLKYIEAFNKMESALSNPYKDASPELQAILLQDKKLQVVENRVDKLENKMTIDYSQQCEIEQNVSKRVIAILGGKDAPAYKNKTVRAKAFSYLYRSLKRAFQVNSYRNIAVKNYEEAILIIKNWDPDEELNLMIIGANSQMVLEGK